ncbi:hypothetical protein NLP99_002875 [Salmonella enterica]|nr:hypothetical protein [Salmonella enterica]
MYIGIDLGTSGVKAILLNEQGDVLATHTEKLTVSRPHPLWSEQEPEQWWQATDRAVKGLGRQQSLSGVRALGIAGQMHGATLLDSRQQVLRPAILWNDGRCSEECAWLEKQVPQSRAITGNLMMPGFTAPKLVWVQRHEPDIFYQIDKVLLPKDFLRLRMTGVFASDMSDAAGTMWLDVKKRDWSDVMLNACHLTRQQMPALFEGSDITGTLLPEVASAWGMPTVPVVEGVGYALADGMDVVHACGVKPASVTLIGGGARSEYWRQMLSDISGLQLDYRTGGDVGPALGAARLAQIAVNKQTPLADVLPQLPLEQAHYPDAQHHAVYQQRRETFRRLYQQLLPLMS